MSWLKPQVRPETARPARYNQVRTLTASAARIDLSSQNEINAMRLRATTAQGWQREVWDYYDAVGEIKFSYNLVANMTSRLRLYAALVEDPNSEPVVLPALLALAEKHAEPGSKDSTPKDPPIPLEQARKITEVFNEQFQNVDVPNLLRLASLNLGLPGEFHLVQLDGKWQVKSTSELTVGINGRATLQPHKELASGQRTLTESESKQVGRVWRQHPQHTGDADSSMKALREDCNELLLLNRMVRGALRSRLNAGALLVSDELSLAARTPTDPDNEDQAEAEGDPFETELNYAMVTPLGSESDGSNVVPMLVRGPTDALNAFKHVEISRSLDPKMVERAASVLDRILQGIDVPKEFVVGMGTAKYANAVAISDSLYKAHIEPLALVICDALTAIVLRPALKDAGVDEALLSRITVWYDPSEVTTSPDRSQDANDGRDRHIISDAAWRRVRGFNENDAPDETELARQLLFDKVQIPPEESRALLMFILPLVLGAAREGALANGALPPELQEALGGGSEGRVPVGEALPEPSVG